MTPLPPPRPPAPVLAEAAWRHLVNRHDLAQALDELAANHSDDEQLLAAVDLAARRLSDRRTSGRPTVPATPRTIR